MDIVIYVRKLRKTYNQIVAVDDISFEVRQGEIFGMVGPNGAGKTTTIECVTGLRCPDAGEISTLGLNPHASGYALHERIGMQLQESVLPDRMQVGEALDLYACLYRTKIDRFRLMEQLGLAEYRQAHYRSLSGGQKQRLSIALALLNDPEVVFFDELTTGIDPQTRRVIWEFVRDMKDKGKTIILTTHNMDEAESLCDRVAIINRGQVIALDTPENLIRRYGMDSRVILNVADSILLEQIKVLDGVHRVERQNDTVTVYGKGEMLAADIVAWFVHQGIRFHNLRTEQSTLNDVFLALTGQGYTERGE